MLSTMIWFVAGIAVGIAITLLVVIILAIANKRLSNLD